MEAIPSNNARLFLHFNEDTRTMSLSAFPYTDIMYESNHIELAEIKFNGQANTHESQLNILRNVLSQGAVQVVIE